MPRGDGLAADEQLSREALIQAPWSSKSVERRLRGIFQGPVREVDCVAPEDIRAQGPVGGVCLDSCTRVIVKCEVAAVGLGGCFVQQGQRAGDLHNPHMSGMR